MPNKKIICVLLLLSFILSLASPVLATPEERKLERVYSLLDDKPLAKPGKSATTSVSIRNIASGDTVYSQVLIIAQAAGTFDSVVYQIDSGPSETVMTRVDSTDRYQANWDTTGLSNEHTLTVKSKIGDRVVASVSASVTVVGNYQWEVYYEIDYMAGYEPSTVVLDYMVDYWKGHAIKVTYDVNELVSDPTPVDGYITDSDFWKLEKEYNQGSDNATEYGRQYALKEKWMLYGTWDANSNVGGYTYVGFVGKDLAAGNYIFIADAMIDAWEGSVILSDGGEVIVTCHEAGHSIGIAVLRGTSEKYDPDAYSIMSYMRLQNAKDMNGYWYYSKEYWSTANLNYYPYP